MRIRCWIVSGFDLIAVHLFGCMLALWLYSYFIFLVSFWLCLTPDSVYYMEIVDVAFVFNKVVYIWFRFTFKPNKRSLTSHP